MIALLILAFSCTDHESDDESDDSAACAAPCERIFGDESGQCNITIPGMVGADGREEMIEECTDHCLHAMSEDGELGDYDPYERPSGDEAVSLENRAQAEAWMECVDATSCEMLDANYCAPVKSFL